MAASESGDFNEESPDLFARVIQGDGTSLLPDVGSPTTSPWFLCNWRRYGDVGRVQVAGAKRADKEGKMEILVGSFLAIILYILMLEVGYKAWGWWGVALVLVTGVWGLVLIAVVKAIKWYIQKAGFSCS